MNILDIDVASFAGRVAYVAAVELYRLIGENEGNAPILDWYDPSGRALSNAAIEADAEAMAGYVLARRCSGETLFRWKYPNARWAGQPQPRQMAYELYATTLDRVGGRLLEVQQAAEKAAERQAAPIPAGMALEDSILAPDGKFGDEIEGAGAMHQAIADQDAKRSRAEQRRRARAAADKAAAAEAEKAGDNALDQAASPSEDADGAPAKTLSIGDAPAKPPVNRGGRGRKKK